MQYIQECYIGIMSSYTQEKLQFPLEWTQIHIKPSTRATTLEKGVLATLNKKCQDKMVYNHTRLYEDGEEEIKS